ncbi:NAD-dependent epimerase/dehydratase family protein [Thiohalorhabdus methylotrophus]|uniref:NAD-dependent epimerase/dehydratase family protein n=1 Tax=Thiohalorhabdus methylotrophus TaxID=3242694 RepID=A0ABV4TV65_9GAMM
MVPHAQRAQKRHPAVAIAGCGYVGARLAAVLAAAGHRVFAGRRTSVVEWPEGVEPFHLDLDTASGGKFPVPASAMVCAFPPGRGGLRDYRMARLLARLAHHPPDRLVYLSTTGVYGNRGGILTPETTPLAPGTDRARRRQDAERQVRAFGARHATSVQILRVSGIYGPGRLPVERIRAGEGLRVDWPEPRFTNAIHVDDLVRLVLAALRQGRPNRAYNACDGVDRRQGALLEAVAAVLGVPLPPPVSPETAYRELSAMRLSFLEESRRCSIRRAGGELGWEPVHTDLEAAVRCSLREEGRL